MSDLEKIERAARVAEKMYPDTQLSAAFRKFADELLRDDETKEILETAPARVVQGSG